MAAAVGLCVTLARGSQVDVGTPVASTPYDRYHGPVKKVLGRCEAGAQPVSVEQVRSLLRTARRFRYYFNKANPYEAQLPEVTEARRSGDCKAKSLWMIQKMNDTTCRYVIGKATPGSRLNHAWLLWLKDGRWFALDPTMESDILLAERIAGRKLFSWYSYTRDTAYFHPSYLTYSR